MSQAICFHCKKKLIGVGKPMEEILDSELPLFCSIECSNNFPDNHTKKFKDKIKALKKGLE